MSRRFFCSSEAARRAVSAAKLAAARPLILAALPKWAFDDETWMAATDASHVTPDLKKHRHPRAVSSVSATLCSSKELLFEICTYRPITPFANSMIAEANAYLSLCSRAKENGVKKLITFCDCSELVKAINKINMTGVMPGNAAHPVYENIKLMLTSFEYSIILFAQHKSQISVVDQLSKEARKYYQAGEVRVETNVMRRLESKDHDNGDELNGSIVEPTGDSGGSENDMIVSENDMIVNVSRFQNILQLSGEGSFLFVNGTAFTDVGTSEDVEGNVVTGEDVGGSANIEERAPIILMTKEDELKNKILFENCCRFYKRGREAFGLWPIHKEKEGNMDMKP